ncbi:MAG: N-acetyltransferase [Deltaproteobacteria bacterium]|nr:N-acetyltransferase [Deltaproteobacteria bacterium]
MSLEIRIVESKKDLKTFVKLPFNIYKGNKYWVPPLIRDEMAIFDRKKNPAYENAESRLFLALRGGKAVGCIAGILSRVANEKYGRKNVRFGWFETVEDYSVARALLDSLQNWASDSGMETITGPQGFTDLDHQGMLIEGFDQLPTISVYYNHTYYPEFLEKYGFEKEIDYIEFKTPTPNPEGVPEKLVRIADKIKQKRDFRILELKSRKEAIRWGPALFELVNEAYEPIYGSVPLSPKQIDYYIKKYISFVDTDLLKIAVDRDEKMAGFLITMPSLSEAFQKARGRLLPLGWYHLLRGLKKNEVLDFYLIGTRQKYRNSGVSLLMAVDILQTAVERGFKYGESSPMLETNKLVHAMHKYLHPAIHKRRRIYKKQVDH